MEQKSRSRKHQSSHSNTQHPPTKKQKKSSKFVKTESQKSKKKSKKSFPHAETESKKKCQICGTSNTPEWRNGSMGENNLCNACGLHFAKSLKSFQEGEMKKEDVEQLLNSNNTHVLTLPIPTNTNDLN